MKVFKADIEKIQGSRTNTNLKYEVKKCEILLSGVSSQQQITYLDCIFITIDQFRPKIDTQPWKYWQIAPGFARTGIIL